MLQRIKRFFTGQPPKTTEIDPVFLQNIARDMQTLIENPTPEGLEAYRKQLEQEQGQGPGLDLFFVLTRMAIDSFSHISLPPKLHKTLWTGVFARCTLLTLATLEAFVAQMQDLGDSMRGKNRYGRVHT